MYGISYTVGIFVEIYALERDAQLLTRLLLSKATPCGADGREQVDLTAFLRPRGPESERSPPWPAVGLLRSLVVTKTDQHNALATKAITKTAR